jgi:hypothetical protein
MQASQRQREWKNFHHVRKQRDRRRIAPFLTSKKEIPVHSSEQGMSKRKASPPSASATGKLRMMPTPITATENPVLPVSLGKRNVVICLLLAAATLALYSPVFRYPFVNYDDEIYVAYNPHVQSGLNWNTMRWAFASKEAGNWHPLTWLSHALDWQLFGSHAAGHHATSVVLHASTRPCCSCCCSGRRDAKSPAYSLRPCLRFIPSMWNR